MNGKARQTLEQRPPTLGLAGGIGSGKSAVAAWLASKGAVVSDSDAAAKALLREPAIRDVLVRWWGSQILAADGFPDRGKIAAMVFSTPDQRLRLEGLIHPILKQQRAAAIEEAARRQPPAPLFVIDAPLLFEAGLDPECDGVLFVDTPRDQRMARVRTGRGWDEQELDRRERAQMPLELKRSRSTFTVVNDAGVEKLQQQLADLWPRLIAMRSPRA